MSALAPDWKWDGTVPRGWKAYTSRPDTWRIQSPQGTPFDSRREALEHMVDAQLGEKLVSEMRLSETRGLGRTLQPTEALEDEIVC